MKFEQKETKDHQVEITVEVDPQKFEETKRKAAKNISTKTKIPGFRPGKAPYDVVRRLYGDETIVEEAIELSINRVYPEIIKESQIQPYGPGTLQEIISNDPPKFRFVVPLEPTVNLKNYQNIRQSYNLPKVTEEDINTVIENLQLNYSAAKEKDTPSQNGDLVAVKIDAILKNPDEDQDAQFLKETPHQVIIGMDNEDDSFPFPGFSKKLTTREKGAKIDFEYKYGKDSRFGKLQNKTAKFEVSIESIKELEKPQLDDDFAKMIGFNTYEDMENSVREQLETAKLNEYDNQYYDEVLEKIIKGADIRYPPPMLENEINDVLNNFEAELSERNMDLPTYLKLNKREKEEFVEKEIKPAAKKRLEQALVIEEISREENIELDQTELQKEYSRSLMQLQSDPNFEKLRKEFTIKKLSDATVMQSATRLLNRRTLERIKAIANGEISQETPQQEKQTQAKSKEISNKKLIQEE